MPKPRDLSQTDATWTAVSHPPPSADPDATQLPDSESSAPADDATLAHNASADRSATNVDPDATQLPDSCSDSEGLPSEATRTFSAPSSGSGAGPTVRRTLGQPASPAPTRYELRGLHARGGLGEVFTAHDTELNRDVALKRIQARFADEPSSRRRFLIEAEVTARLDHPGVVPVFGLVTDANGRPSYAMRFIQGESLRDEIDHYYQKNKAPDPKSERTEPLGATTTGSGSAAATRSEATAVPVADEHDRRLAFRQLLARFIAVCQAIAYAHTRQVIHRDIKPANIMVGTFGETLVVDWGLAKVLGGENDEAGSGNPNDEGSSDATMMGTAVGTPAYMAPEQAAGDLSILGPAADIYSLGATLYCILAGRAPFGGSMPTETLRLVQKGEFVPPQQVNPEVPAPLNAICLKAMAVRIQDRYPTAQALAADVERWLSDEPVSCYPESRLAQLARWGRRNPARVAAGVSLLLTGLVATAAILFVVGRAKQQTEAALVATRTAEAQTRDALEKESEAKAATQQALVRVTEEQHRTEEQRQAAVTAGDLARSRFALARRAFETTVLGIQSRLADRAGTQQLRQELLHDAQQGLQRLLATATQETVDRQEADRLLFWARLQMGDVQKALGDTAAARAEYTASATAAEKLVHTDPSSILSRGELATAYDRLANINLQAGQTAAAREASVKAIALRERLAAAAPMDSEAKRNLADSKNQLAVVELERGDTRAARAAIAESLKARQELHDAHPMDERFTHALAQGHDRQAEILLRTGDTAGAHRAAQAALALQQAEAKAHPHSESAQRQLAAAYSRLGEVNFDRADMAAALAAYRRSAAVLDALLKADPLSAGAKLDTAATQGRIGAVLLKTGDAAGALAEARKSIALGHELATADPDSARAKRTLAFGHISAGDALLASGNILEAIAEYEAARLLLDGLTAHDTGSARVRSEQAEGLEHLGTAQLAAGQLAAAIATLTDAAAIRDEAARTDPDSAQAQRQLAAGQERLCAAYLKADSHVRARVAVYKAIAALRDVAAKDPAGGQTQRDLAAAYAQWGEVALDQNDATAAMILWNKSLARFNAVAAIDSTNSQAQADRAAALERISTVNGVIGYPEAQLESELAALAIWEKLAAAYPTNPTFALGEMTSKRRVGDVLVQQRQFTAALQSYKDARALGQKASASPIFQEEIARVAERIELIEAIRAGTVNPAGLSAYPPGLRARALVLLISEHLRLKEPANAARAAEVLIENARGPDDLYAAAKGFAGAAARVTPTEAKRDYGRLALNTLTQAARAGFRHADELEASDWDGLRKEPAFQAAEAMIRAHLPLAPPPRAVPSK